MENLRSPLSRGTTFPHPNPDGTTSHSTRLPNNGSVVAGYPPEGEGTFALPPTGGGERSEGALEGGISGGASYRTVHEQLKPCVDVERITARIALRSARPRDLSGLRDTLLTLPQLHAVLAKCDAPLIKDLADALQAEHALVELLQRTIKPEPSSVLREGGVIADGFDAELDELRGIQTNCGDFLLALEARERARTGITTLKVEYNRVHGFYIEVTHAQSGNVPDDYRRRQTLKNAERYITPELKAFEDKALSANERALARERFLYEQLLDQLAPSIAATAAHRRRDRRTRRARHLCRTRRHIESQRAAIFRRAADQHQQGAASGGGSASGYRSRRTTPHSTMRAACC